MKPLLLTTLMFVSPVLLADYDIDAKHSALSFISVKKSAIAEQHVFKRLAGRVDEHGLLSVSVDLNSVDTGIAIRNERLQKQFFEVGKYPSATLTAQLPIERLKSIKSGSSVDLVVASKLSLHGFSVELPIKLAVFKQADGSLRALTKQPILLHVADFGLTDGVELLRSLAALPVIDQVVPVSFDVVLTPS